jgi:hypothetical protein
MPLKIKIMPLTFFVRMSRTRSWSGRRSPPRRRRGSSARGTTRDRFYKTPFRPKTFSDKFLSSKTRPSSIQKQHIHIYVSIVDINLVFKGIWKQYKVIKYMITNLNLTKKGQSVNYGRNVFIKSAPGQDRRARRQWRRLAHRR